MMMRRLARFTRTGLLATAAIACACGSAAFAATTTTAATSTPAQRTEAALAAAVAAAPQNPTALTFFLEHLPKGGDLHHHLTGSVYAESYIDYAVEDGDCIDEGGTILPPPCDPAKGIWPAAHATDDLQFRNKTIDILSARNYIAGNGDASPEVHFFQTFFKFDLVVNKHWGEELAEVEHRSALEHELYIETDLSPDKFASMALGDKVGWTPNFDQMRAKLDAAGVPALVAQSRKNLDEGIASSRKILGCDGATPDPGCGLTMRFIFQVLRDRSNQEAFAQIQTAFELANADARVVSVNPVESQDDFKALRNYDIQMQMFGYFHKLYPNVKLAMHAGELRPGLVPPEAMERPSEIREAIEVAGASRIGHGLDVLYEHDPEQLLAMMAQKHILVEVAGGHSMLPIYIAAGVPVALATDDEGVGRIDLMTRYDYAAEHYHIDYYGLKKMIRDSLEHAFIGGADLWSEPEGFDAMVPACAGTPLAAQPAAPACRAFLASSARATLEWNEEVALAAFEARY
jgi:adenosine deaminase